MGTLKQLTSEQLAFLKQFEDNFRTATQGGWARQRPAGADKKMVEILEKVTGKRYPFRAGCGQCELNLLRDIAKIYYPAKEAEEAAAQSAKVTPAPKEEQSKTSKRCKKNDKK